MNLYFLSPILAQKKFVQKGNLRTTALDPNRTFRKSTFELNSWWAVRSDSLSSNISVQSLQSSKLFKENWIKTTTNMIQTALYENFNYLNFISVHNRLSKRRRFRSKSCSISSLVSNFLSGNIALFLAISG